MPAYNASATIEQAVNSVIDQDFKDWHLYIIDDASHDNTFELAGKFQDERITVIKNRNNKGVAESRNIALNICKGNYVAFIDSDDMWIKNKLSLQMEKLEDGWDLVCSNFIGNLTGIYNREKLGIFNQVNEGHEDYIMWLDIISVTNRAYCIQECLAKYRVNEHSLSSNKIKAIAWQWNIYRKNRRLSFLHSIKYIIYYFFHALLKRV
ncbi:TPA: glycosyltransferase family 2 protein [Escherichia coli]|nr:glycosyltransferase family 2 protein [Escherichia coli]